eukprot:gene217-4463_t
MSRKKKILINNLLQRLENQYLETGGASIKEKEDDLNIGADAFDYTKYIISKKIETFKERLNEYKEKRKLGSSQQEILKSSRDLNQMIEFIEKDFQKLKKLNKAESSIRMFKWSRNEERIKSQQEDLEIIELHLNQIKTLISKKNEVTTSTYFDSNTTNRNSTFVKFKENSKTFEKYENVELPKIDISDSKLRLEEYQKKWQEEMNKFKNQLEELGDKNMKIKDQLEYQNEKIEKKIEIPLDEQTIKINKVNKEIDGAQKEIGRNCEEIFKFVNTNIMSSSRSDKTVNQLNSDFLNNMSPTPLIVSIDLGTTSTRVLVFDEHLNVVSSSQQEYTQFHQNPGWTDQNPIEVFEKTLECINSSVIKAKKEIQNSKVISIGITNQRETTLVWDKETEKPLYNAIVWHDTRTSNIVEELIRKNNNDKFAFQKKVGLPLSTYFSASKLKWLIENSKQVQNSIKKGTCMFGTFDSWLIWKLTGGKDSGKHITDVTNASRTMFMDIKTLQWDNEMKKVFEIPTEVIFPEIKSSSEIYGKCVVGECVDVPISCCLGDQQAALVGHQCFEVGEAKNTYGTGCFMLMNVGKSVVYSKSGLLSTVAYKFGKEDAVYALEGSVSVCGSGINWLVQDLGLFESVQDLDAAVSKVSTSEGVIIVPSFSGLFAPYWNPNAKFDYSKLTYFLAIFGLTFYSNKSHIARAMFEGICFRIKEVLEIMVEDTDHKVEPKVLKVDGGVTNSKNLLQIQSNLSNIRVERPKNVEMTARGAAIGSALGVGFWKDYTQVPKQAGDVLTFECKMTEDEIDSQTINWKNAITSTNKSKI